MYVEHTCGKEVLHCPLLAQGKDLTFSFLYIFLIFLRVYIFSFKNIFNNSTSLFLIFLFFNFTFIKLLADGDYNDDDDRSPMILKRCVLNKIQKSYQMWPIMVI